MATYSLATTALALNVDRKRVENLLLRYSPGGLSPGRQGRARRLPREVVVALAVLLELQDRLGIPAPRGAELLPRLLDSENPTVVAGAATVSLDRQQLEARVVAALATALEMAPRPRRGRRPGTRSSLGEKERGALAPPSPSD